MHLKGVMARVQQAQSVEDKVAALLREDSVSRFMGQPRHAAVCEVVSTLPPQQQLVLLSLPAMLQEHVLQEPPSEPRSAPAALRPRLLDLAARLGRVEQFYDSVGGVLGYQLKSLELIVAGMQDKAARKHQPQHAPVDPTQLHRTQPQVHTHGGEQQQQQQQRPQQEVRYRVPKGVDLAGEEGSGVGVAAAAQGLAALPFLAEIYPVGGAGDRLGLVDEATGESLPAAMLPYAGRTLMEVLIRDLQAREYLYWQLTGRQVTTPVAIMTSDAKGNHDRVSRLLSDLGWAGRGQAAFRLFRQPMVPVVAVEDGRWLLSGVLRPMMKPGGHGAIWKLMWDEGVFSWLGREQGRRAALVRQISNPMAGTDTTLLALAGTGFSRGYGGSDAFGFMSCERAVGAAEGMNVLAERKKWVEEEQQLPAGTTAKKGRWVYEYGVTNVEYTEFEKLGLSDEAVSAGSKTSVFPANTNVLYVGMRAAQRVVAEAISRRDGEQLLPGLIFNLNKKVSYTDPLTGTTRQVTAGRMESTMQNMADYLADRREAPLDDSQLASTKLSTFLVSNMRRKVTSSAKKRREPGSARIAQTPDGSFYDLQRNAWQILQRCGLKKVPEPGSPEQYLAQGPGFIFLYHPALGPLWDVISQKVVGGSLAPRSELVLELAEARLLDVHVDGSLQIYAENAMGHMEHPPSAAGSQYDLALANELNHHANGRNANDHVLAISSLQPNGSTAITEIATLGGVGPAAGQSHGQRPAGGLLRYSHCAGRVQMVNVVVRNAGINWEDPSNVYWKHQVARRETCKVVLLGQSEFEAFDVLIPGNQTFVVPHGHRLTITAAPDGSSDIVARLSPLCRTDADVNTAAVGGGGGGGFVPTWEWRYTMDESGAVRLSYVSSGVRTAAAAGALTTVLSAAQSRAQQHVLDFTI